MRLRGIDGLKGLFTYDATEEIGKIPYIFPCQ